MSRSSSTFSFVVPSWALIPRVPSCTSPTCVPGFATWSSWGSGSEGDLRAEVVHRDSTVDGEQRFTGRVQAGFPRCPPRGRMVARDGCPHTDPGLGVWQLSTGPDPLGG